MHGHDDKDESERAEAWDAEFNSGRSRERRPVTTKKKSYHQMYLEKTTDTHSGLKRKRAHSRPVKKGGNRRAKKKTMKAGKMAKAQANPKAKAKPKHRAKPKMKSHAKAKPKATTNAATSKSFYCDECQMSFSGPSGLFYHRVKQHGHVPRRYNK